MKKQAATVCGYCADILVPDSRRADGLRNVMVGCHAPTEAETVTKAVDAATYYLGDPCWYRSVTYRVHALCSTCQGRGHVYKMRRGKPVPHSYHDCPDCHGEGSLYMLPFPPMVRSILVDDIDRGWRDDPF